MLRVKIYGVEAKFVPLVGQHDGRWESKEQAIAELLNSTIDPFGMTGHEPDPEQTALEWAKAVLPNIQVVSKTDISTEFDSSVTY